MFYQISGFAYRIQTGLRLRNAEKEARIVYSASVLLAMVYDDPLFLSNVWFSYESHIHFNGFISPETTNFLGFENQISLWRTASFKYIQKKNI